MMNGYILLPASLEVLGGRVADLAERWELQHELASHSRAGKGDGVPRFEPFNEVRREDDYL